MLLSLLVTFISFFFDLVRPAGLGTGTKQMVQYYQKRTQFKHEFKQRGSEQNSLVVFDRGHPLGSRGAVNAHSKASHALPADARAVGASRRSEARPRVRPEYPDEPPLRTAWLDGNVRQDGTNADDIKKIPFVQKAELKALK